MLTLAGLLEKQRGRQRFSYKNNTITSLSSTAMPLTKTVFVVRINTPFLQLASNLIILSIARLASGEYYILIYIVEGRERERDCLAISFISRFSFTHLGNVYKFEPLTMLDKCASRCRNEVPHLLRTQSCPWYSYQK